MVHNLNDWIIIVIRNWIVITSKILWNKYLLTLFKLEYEHLFHQTNLSKHTFNIENINKTTDSEHKSNLNKLFFNNLSNNLVVELCFCRSVIVHLHSIDFNIGKDVNAFRFIKKTKSVLEVLTGAHSCLLFGFFLFFFLFVI